MNWPHSIASAPPDFKLKAKAFSDLLRFRAFFVSCGIVCSIATLKPFVGLGLAIGVVGLCLGLHVFLATLHGKVEPTILAWVLIFPLGYYFLSFPREHSLITLDRLFVVVLLSAVLMGPRSQHETVARPLRRAAIAWATFLLFAAASFILKGNPLVSGHLFLDSFVLPAVLAWVIIRNFPVEENAGRLHLLISLMCFYAASIAAVEMVINQDLLPLPGDEGGLGLAGALPRPNGPFGTNDSLALIGSISFFLLIFLRKSLGSKVSPWRRPIHAIGLTSSLGMALMPMFRSVDISLALILLIASIRAPKPRQRLIGFAVLAICTLAVSLIGILAPDTYEDRTNPDNVYGRLAEQRQMWRLFCDHALLGVGLGHFGDAVSGDARYSEFYNGVQSVDSPHNNLGGILAETGCLGFVFYIAAQGLLFLAFWRLRSRANRSSQLAWTYFLYIFLTYWISGLSLQSGYSSDLNLWFVFALMILYKYAESYAPNSLSPA